jgi:hypothetical protein
MKLVKLRDGEPLPESKDFEVAVHGHSMLVKCPCGMVWTTTTPSPGQRREEMCPGDCGHGIDMDARLGADVEWPVPVFVDSGAFSEVDFPQGVPTVVKPITAAEWAGRLATMLDLAQVRLPPIADTLKGLTLTRLADDVKDAVVRLEPGIPVREAPMPPGAQMVDKPAWMSAEVLQRLRPALLQQSLAEFRIRLRRLGSEEVFLREYLGKPGPAGYDWFCAFCLLGYYSPDVERSDAEMRPLCRCGRILNGSGEQPEGLRSAGDDSP